MQNQLLDYNLSVSHNLKTIQQACEDNIHQTPIDYSSLSKKYEDYCRCLLADIRSLLDASVVSNFFNHKKKIHPKKLVEFKGEMRSHINYLSTLACLLDGQESYVAAYDLLERAKKLVKKTFGNNADEQRRISFVGLSKSLFHYWSDNLRASQIEKYVISPEELENQRKFEDAERAAERASNERKVWYLVGASIMAPLVGGLIAGKAGADAVHVFLENVLRITIDSVVASTANAVLATADDYSKDKLSLENTSMALLDGAKYGALAGVISEGQRDIGQAITWLKNTTPPKNSTTTGKSDAATSEVQSHQGIVDDNTCFNKSKLEELSKTLMDYRATQPSSFSTTSKSHISVTESVIEMPTITTCGVSPHVLGSNVVGVENEKKTLGLINNENNTDGVEALSQKIILGSLPEVDSDKTEHVLFNGEELMLIFGLSSVDNNEKNTSIESMQAKLSVAIFNSKQVMFSSATQSSVVSAVEYRL